MVLEVRAMVLAEYDIVVDYFHGATPEHLEMIAQKFFALSIAHAGKAQLEIDIPNLTAFGGQKK